MQTTASIILAVSFMSKRKYSIAFFPLKTIVFFSLTDNK